MKVEGVRFLSLCGFRRPMRMKDLLVGKSALSYLNQSLRLEPLAAQTRCTLSPFDLLVKTSMVQLYTKARRRRQARKEERTDLFPTREGGQPEKVGRGRWPVSFVWWSLRVESEARILSRCNYATGMEEPGPSCRYLQQSTKYLVVRLMANGQAHAI